MDKSLFIKRVMSILIAVLIGLFTSVICNLFLLSLEVVIALSKKLSYLTLVIMIIFYFVYNNKIIVYDFMVSPTKKVFENKLLNRFILIFQLPLVLASHLAGASVGREGVGVLIGASVAQQFRKYLFLPLADINLIAMGTGFASIFATPLSGFFFSLDYMKTINYKTIILLLVSIVTTVFCNSLFNHSSLAIEHQSFHLSYKLIIIAFAGYLTGKIFVILLSYFKKHLDSKNKQIILLLLIILIMYFTKARYQSLGINLIEDSFNAVGYNYDFILKTFLTVSFISIGFQGGEVTPLFAIGASLGALFSQILGLNLYSSCAIGFVSVFVGATNGYLCGIMLCIELFDSRLCLIIVFLFLLKKVIFFNKSIYN